MKPRGHRKTADQDNHKCNWGNVTQARTAVLAPSLTKAALLTAMKQRRVYATEDQNLRLVYRVNGQLLGSRILGAAVPASGSALTIALTITDDDESGAAYTVEVFFDELDGTVAELVRTQNVTGNGTHAITGVGYSGGAQYVCLRIRQAGDDRAWTAPVWLEPTGTPLGGDALTGGDVRPLCRHLGMVKLRIREGTHPHQPKTLGRATGKEKLPVRRLILLICALPFFHASAGRSQPTEAPTRESFSGQSSPRGPAEQGSPECQSVADRVTAIVVEQLGVDEEEVTPDASFVDDLGADSLDTVELVMAFEEEFGIEIPDEDAANITRVQEAIDYVEARTKANGCRN